MTRNSAHLSMFFGFAVVGLAIGLSGCNSSTAGPPPMPAPMMTVAKPVQKRIVEWDSYTGRLEPIEYVEVRARVGGYLQSIHFDEGQIVEEGDLLFVIDPRPYQAVLNGAKASLGQAKSQLVQAHAQMEEAKAQEQQADAQMTLATARVQRARQLSQQSAISKEELDQRVAENLQAQADVAAAKAGLSAADAAIATADAAIAAAQASIDAAELELEYTEIRAPVSGRISREYVTEGNLISDGSAGATLLTTIASVAPVYCTFDISEQQAIKYLRLAQAGTRRSSREAKNPVFLGLSDEPDFPHRGHMDFVDNRFDANTASVRVRGIFRNEDESLVPGMFARVRLPGSAAYEAILIPDSAIGTDQSSAFVYVVENGKTQRRTVSLGPIVDGLRVIRSGLDGSESLVISGLLNARPDIEVQTQDGLIAAVEDGLPDTYDPLPPEEWIAPNTNPKGRTQDAELTHRSEPTTQEEIQ